MTVPTGSNAVWTVGVKYKTPMSPLEHKLFTWCKPVPMLRSLLPNNGDHFVYDSWHMGTNVTTEH
jgi:hypothetical protein